MQYDGLAWAVALLGMLVLWVALRILFNSSWFLGWLRGTLGLAFLAAAGLVGLIAYDLMSYSPLPVDQPLATVSFQTEGAQRFRVDLSENGKSRSVVLDGDLWRLDVRLFQLRGLAELIGLESGYRLERLAGRFQSQEQQLDLAYRTRASLGQSRYGIDPWQWLHLSQRDLFLFEPRALRMTYLPMRQGATYHVRLTPTGLLVEAANDVARQALASR
jgi:hypothetical protein